MLKVPYISFDEKGLRKISFSLLSVCNGMGSASLSLSQEDNAMRYYRQINETRIEFSIENDTLLANIEQAIPR